MFVCLELSALEKELISDRDCAAVDAWSYDDGLVFSPDGVYDDDDPLAARPEDYDDDFDCDFEPDEDLFVGSSRV